jgi:hypothetical protein
MSLFSLFSGTDVKTAPAPSVDLDALRREDDEVLQRVSPVINGLRSDIPRIPQMHVQHQLLVCSKSPVYCGMVYRLLNHAFKLMFAQTNEDAVIVLKAVKVEGILMDPSYPTKASTLLESFEHHTAVPVLALSDISGSH